MRFAIRDLLLVTVIVALALGWWVEHRAASRLAVLLAEERNFRLSLVEIEKSELKKYPHPGIVRIWGEPYLKNGDY